MFAVLEETQLLPYIAFVFGLLIGSFLNVVIYRIPKMMELGWEAEYAAYAAQKAGNDPSQVPIERFNLLTPASTCRQCGHRIRWYENIPIVSYVFLLRGKCATCKTPIGLRYPLVELVTGLLAAWCAWRYGAQAQALMWFVFAAIMLTLALIDWDTTYLPDSLTLPLMWAGLLAASQNLSGISLNQALWGAVVGYLSLWSVYWAFKLATGKEGMGYGDFKLFAALGAWFGAIALIPIILLAAISGAVIGIVMKATNGLREGRYVPFGPFLALGGALVWFAGTATVLRWIGLAA